MAIVTTGGRSDMSQEFTSNRRLLLAAVDKFMGQKLISNAANTPATPCARSRASPTGSVACAAAARRCCWSAKVSTTTSPI
jgi:hypothetical protein